MYSLLGKARMEIIGVLFVAAIAIFVMLKRGGG